MGLGHSPSIVVDGLVFYIDPNNTTCYPGFGNTLYNIVNTSIGGTFVNYTSNPIDNTETRSVFFDGSDDYIQTNYIPYFTSDFTLEVFAKFARYNDYQCILSSMNNGSAVSGFWLEFGTGRGFTIYTSGSQLVLEDNVVSLTNLDLNKWHHIVVSRSGTGTSNIKLYVNNILCGQNTSNAAIGHTSFAMMMGKYDYVGSYSYFKGNLGSVKIYSKGLTATEILQNYNATKKKYSPDENIVTNGLVLNIDPANSNSYPGTGNTVYDLSGFGNTLFLYNGPTFNYSNNGSITFDGTNDYGMVLHSNNLNLTYMSVSAWFNFPSVPFSGLGINKELSFRLISGESYPTTAGGRLGGSWSTGVGPGATTLRQNNWYQIVMTADGTTQKLYVNGLLDYSTNNSALASTNTNFISFAAYHSGAGYFLNCLMSQVQIYNRALTQQEVQQNYNATKKRFVNALPPVRNGLVMELDAGQRSSYPGTGNTWYDLSGNALNSTLSGSPSFAGIGATGYLIFDANTKSGSFDTSLLSNYSSGTIECSVYITNLTSSFIFARQRNGVNTYSVLSVGTYTDTGGQVATGTTGTVYYHNKNAQTVLSSSSLLSVNTWYRLAITFTTSSVILYINGVQNSTVAGDYSVPSDISTDPRIGAWIKDGTNYPMNGRLAHFVIYNRALSAYEVKQNFDFYRTRYNI